MALVDVAGVDQLREGVPHVVLVGRREIVLVQTDGTVFALRNVCPHQTQSFGSGIVRPLIEPGAEPGEITVDRGRPVLACPWHRWEYDLRSGRCVIDPRLRVRAYRTVVDCDRVLIEMTS
jgi:nitrite reductase/ring-hydroxylating ferredoxin subunit